MGRPFAFIKASSSLLDLTTLSLEAWLRAGSSYTAGTGTWTGTASAGGSGSRNFTQSGSGKPTAGANLNGLATVSFASASSQYLQNSNTPATFINSTGYSTWALIKNTSSTGAGAKTAGYGNGAVWSDSTSYWAQCLSTTNSGVAQQYHWDSAGRGVEYALVDGSWSLIQTYFNGTTLGLRVNSGAWQTTSATTLGSTTGLVYLGSNYNGSKFLNGLLADVALSKTVFTSQQFDDIKARLNSDYGLSL